MTETRTYKSPLREEQMAQTREKILEKVVEILATPNVELTVAEAAKRANISVRTAYRYFPTKEALLDAFQEYSGQQLGFPVSAPKSLDELVDYAGALGRTFIKNEPVLRAQQRSVGGEEIRRRRKHHLARMLRRPGDEPAPGADESGRGNAAGALVVVGGFEPWVLLRDAWGLEPEECIEQFQWSVGAIIAQLHKAAKKR